MLIKKLKRNMQVAIAPPLVIKSLLCKNVKNASNKGVMAVAITKRTGRSRLPNMAYMPTCVAIKRAQLPSAKGERPVCWETVAQATAVIIPTLIFEMNP
mmetsp:Transcript_10589/g.15800  ORF Transcript_10589/g.15800 Transcript_10589/m.15800 type:complete len:99 (-) Transcript_10589:392-688(-)